jgi:hypothetical protein
MAGGFYFLQDDFFLDASEIILSKKPALRQLKCALRKTYVFRYMEKAYAGGVAVTAAV